MAHVEIHRCHHRSHIKYQYIPLPPERLQLMLGALHPFVANADQDHINSGTCQKEAKTDCVSKVVLFGRDKSEQRETRDLDEVKKVRQAHEFDVGAAAMGAGQLACLEKGLVLRYREQVAWKRAQTDAHAPYGVLRIEIADRRAD